MCRGTAFHESSGVWRPAGDYRPNDLRRVRRIAIPASAGLGPRDRALGLFLCGGNKSVPATVVATANRVSGRHRLSVISKPLADRSPIEFYCAISVVGGPPLGSGVSNGDMGATLTGGRTLKGDVASSKPSRRATVSGQPNGPLRVGSRHWHPTRYRTLDLARRKRTSPRSVRGG